MISVPICMPHRHMSSVASSQRRYECDGNDPHKGDPRIEGRPQTYAYGARNHELGSVTHHPLLVRVFASCEKVGSKRGRKSKQSRAEQCNRGEFPARLQVNLFLASLRAFPTRYFSQHTNSTTQYPPRSETGVFTPSSCRDNLHFIFNETGNLGPVPNTHF